MSVAAPTVAGVTRLTQTYTYLRPSDVRTAAPGRPPALHLSTSGGSTPQGAPAHPRFYSGFLTAAQAAAAGLLAVADVAATRYDRRPAPGLLDPVVTAGGDRLRLESFSGCCGVYARLDVLPEGLDGSDIGHGTTNVDVNARLREALSRIGAADPLHLDVGAEDLVATTVDGPLLEKKVPLPDRWLRGFAETAVLAPGFDLRAELPADRAVDFLRTLPRPGTRGPGTAWAVPAGGSLRLTTRPVPGAVCLAGPARLTAFSRLLRHARGLRVYGPPARADSAPAPSAWEVALPGMRLTLLLSPDPARGLSGEGAVLEALTGQQAAEDGEFLALLLGWEPRIDPADLADRSALATGRVRAALTWLATAGQIGYDTAEAAYFHRELPYDAHRVERHNPRLRDARALAASGAVAVDGDMATVVSGEEAYRVRHADGALSCTCPWWAAHRGGRGPCKHALAVRIARRTPATARAARHGTGTTQAAHGSAAAHTTDEAGR